MKTRMRRLRRTAGLRRLVRQTELSVNNLVMPYFVVEGKNKKLPVTSMPSAFQFALDRLIIDVRETVKAGIPAVLLFGIPAKKDAAGSGAFTSNGIVQQAVRSLKITFPELVVITDVCLCEYTSDGHCQIGNNDQTLKTLARVAVSHARAGADIVAPSAMMDGQVKAIRTALDKNGFSETAIMAYAAKYASAFYGPFRDAAQSAPKHGDRKSYQMDFGNAKEALREVELDINEGADIIMVKPVLAYLDIIRQVRDRFNVPLAAYNVSGEYSLVKAAGQKGWVDEQKLILEILTAIKRSGAGIIITYHAKEIAKVL